MKSSQIFWFSNSSSLPHPASFPKAYGFSVSWRLSFVPTPPLAAALKQWHSKPGGPGSTQGPANHHHPSTSLCFCAPQTGHHSSGRKSTGFSPHHAQQETNRQRSHHEQVGQIEPEEHGPCKDRPGPLQHQETLGFKEAQQVS